MLIHGGGAHLHWWDFIAPQLAENFYVVALDLGGMGDSGRRKEYTPESYIAEVVAVADATGLDNQAVLAGHSMGGAGSSRSFFSPGHARLPSASQTRSPGRERKIPFAVPEQTFLPRF